VTFGHLLGLVAAPIAFAAAAMSAYLLALSLAAFVASRRAPPPGRRTTRFAVLVPAHNEASTIGRLLRTLAEQDYPHEFRDVFVVADNCTDETAHIARSEGAMVHERTDPERRAKGHALQWLLQRVRAEARYDAYVFIDADSEIDRDFLSRMDSRLEAGSRVIQSHYSVLNPYTSGTTALREASLASLHYLRPLGRTALGLSCGLKGNGMCFAAKTLEMHGWTATGLAEDVELHLALVRAGIRVDFAHEAAVRADMPATLRDSRTQNLRWEAGRLAAARRDAVPLLWRGIVTGDAMIADAAAEQLIPPLSVAVAAATVSGVLAAASGNPAIAIVGLFGAGGLALHVLLGLVAVRAPLRLYSSLLGAPAYVLWKVALYARAMATSPAQPWVRTPRDH